MKKNDLIGYGIMAVIIAMVLQYTWQWIVGGLALFGVVYVFDQLNRNHRN